MTPEQTARQRIDAQLVTCGWKVQDYRQMNISAGLGVAVREFPLSTGDGDYLLYADAKAIGVIEASNSRRSRKPVKTGGTAEAFS
jgi:type I restriction enzyme R subunit